jgi:hypothetical protein
MATKKAQSEFQEPNAEGGQQEVFGELSVYEVPGLDDAMTPEVAKFEAEALCTALLLSGDESGQ